MATDTARQEQVWRAAQKLIISGQRLDFLSVADAGYRLSQRGFAPNLPWRSMGYSADREMRRLAAALVPFLPEVDFEAVKDLASDAMANVRCELAISLRMLAAGEGVATVDQERLLELVTKLRDDPSFRVRSSLPSS